MMYISHCKKKTKKKTHQLFNDFFSDERLINSLVKGCNLFEEYDLLRYLKLEAITFFYMYS